MLSNSLLLQRKLTLSVLGGAILAASTCFTFIHSTAAPSHRINNNSEIIEAKPEFVMKARLRSSTTSNCGDMYMYDTILTPLVAG